MIVKIQMKIKDQTITMMFGDSYKKWDEQFNEYAQMTSPVILKVETSKAEWIGYGGLKWCNEDYFQEQLDEEGEGRKFDQMVFASDRKISDRVHQIASRFLTLAG